MNQNKKETSTAWLIPILLVIALVPLITIIHTYDSGLQKNLWFTDSGTVYDFFLYYKEKLLRILGVCILCVMSYFIVIKDMGNFTEKKSWLPMIPAGVFALFSIFSALFSEHLDDAIWGGYEQFEGLFAILSYVISFLFMFAYIRTEKWLDIVVKTLIIGSLIVSVLGAFQAIGLDYIQSSWMKSILTSMESMTKQLSVKLNFEDGMAFSTLYNPNYVGSYVAVLLPITVLLTIYIKNLSFKIMAGVSSVCQLIMLYASKSLTGCIGVIGATLVFFIFLLPSMKRNLVKSLIGVGACVLAAVIVLVAKPDLLSRFSDHVNAIPNTIQTIETKNDSFTIEMGSGKKIVAKVNTADSIYSVSIVDGDGNTPQSEGEITNGGMKITEKGYGGLQFIPSRVQLAENNIVEGLKIKVDGREWNLVLKNNKIKYFNTFGKLDTLKKVDAIGFENHYNFATKRGYIWAHTFPLLGQTAILGAGADNFIYAFPNDDYVGKINCNYAGQIITKPHNMYLQIWVQDGMLACLALIALFVMLFIDTWKTAFFEVKKSYFQKLSIAILCSVSGYMVVGLANDSTITVAPVFWSVLGLGFAVNYMIRREKLRIEEERIRREEEMKVDEEKKNKRRKNRR